MYTRILNTHLQIPVHIHKLDYAYTIEIKLHNSPLTLNSKYIYRN